MDRALTLRDYQLAKNQDYVSMYSMIERDMETNYLLFYFTNMFRQCKEK